MSFKSSIGHFMDRSGLREVLDLIDAENTTPHLLSGKALGHINELYERSHNN
jgi:hypothetical protein